MLSQLSLFESLAPDRFAESDFVSFGPFLFLLNVRAVFIDNQRLVLRPKAYDLLLFLLQRPMRTFSRTFLLEYVWGLSSLCSTNTVDVHVSVLRRKLAPFGLSDVIETVHGFGYMCSLK